MKMLIVLLLSTFYVLPADCQTGEKAKPAQPVKVTMLPQPVVHGKLSFEKVLHSRRSVRNFKDQAITPEQLSQLLWAAQGITDYQGFRTAPSAGALYPLEVYAVVGKVEALPAGIYKYQPEGGGMVEQVLSGDRREEIAKAAPGQEALKKAAVILLFTGVYERTSVKYGERAERYVHIEVGAAAQNVLLQATALGLGAVPMGAFQDEELKKAASLQEDESPLLLVPVGVP